MVIRWIRLGRFFFLLADTGAQSFEKRQTEVCQLEAQKPSIGSHSGPSVTDLDSLSNHLPFQMIPANDAAEWLSALTHAWHNQQLAGQHNLQNNTATLGHNVYGSPGLELLEAPPSASLNYDPTTVQVQDQHSGSTSSLGTSEAGSSSVPPQQAQGSMVSHTDTWRDAPTQDSQLLKALVPDQVCTCATCLNNCWYINRLRGLEEHPERLS